jgi:hypothetical protein
MSGALVELVATGVQDAYLTGKPEVSFFRQSYKRHTNFALKTVQLSPIGTIAANSEVSLPIPSKGDLLTQVWIDGADDLDSDSAQSAVFELWIGGQMVDRQDSTFTNQIYTQFLADTDSKASHSPTNRKWTPLQFFFCADCCSLPLVALQYQEVEIRVKFATNAPSSTKFYAQYVVLDTDERTRLAETEQEILITQVQKIQSSSTAASGSNRYDLNLLNHPIKSLFWCIPSVDSSSPPTDFITSNVQIYLNGNELFGSRMDDKFFREIQPYFHTDHTTVKNANVDNKNLKMYSFALKANRLQPTGTCNFSRLDNADLVIDDYTKTGGGFSYLYAVNYNVLRVKSGMAGVAFAN